MLKLKKNILVPEFKQAIVYLDDYPEVPVAAVIEGYSGSTKLKHEYNFFEFRTFVERKTDIYVVSSLLEYLYFIKQERLKINFKATLWIILRESSVNS